MKFPMLAGYFRLLRIRQWVKNIFVLAPLIFSGEFLNVDSLVRSLIAFSLFCIASSATYVINDIHDIELDRKHPIKAKSRPLAAGLITVRQANFLLCILCSILILGYFQQPSTLSVIVIYTILNIGYTFVLKYQPIIDIFTIAIGFVLRVYAGAVAVDVPVSSWMFITTLCLALYLAATKRKQELVLNEEVGENSKRHYTIAIVDRYAEISATAALVFYSLFVMSSRQQLVMTIPFVLFGIYRYWYVVESGDKSESPTDALLEDWQLIITVLIWVILCIYLLSRGV
jgi:4-hydroxybenzoate polyprenyltransferase